MSDRIDTSAEAVEALAVRLVGHPWGRVRDAAATLRALLAERDTALAALAPFLAASALAEPESGGRIWADSMVALLNARQARTDMHPYTCPGDHKECEGQRHLIATPQGWRCACGRYTQNWSHETGGPRND